MDRLGIGLIGLGTVGSGVARLLAERGELLAKRAGKRLELRWAAVRDVSRPRDAPLGSARLSGEIGGMLNDPDVDVVVEAMGGTVAARKAVLDALDAGKDVVTANKALLAEHGPEIFEKARKCGRALAFEASVGGGIPIVQALGVGLAANQVLGLAAIVNGTCNFILSAMTRDGLPYADALRQAQELGYAESDPTLDVDGTDTAHKLAVLAQLAFGASVTTAQIPRRGIDDLQSADIRYAAELGYSVKLLALAKLGDPGLELRVAPRLVRKGTPLADVTGPYNAIRVLGDAVGDTLFYGRGAGSLPTASAVVGDLIDVAVGRAALTFRSLNLWNPDDSGPGLALPGRSRSRHYLRFAIADRPGVLGAIAQVLGAHGISIASVIQHDPGDDSPPESPVALVMMTHSAIELSVRDAIEEIDRMDVVRPKSVCLGVED